jgi:magnesium transporter
MADSYFPLLDEVEDEIDILEDQILENATQETLHRIFTLKQQLVYLRKITAPMRDVMNALAGTRYGMISEHTAFYFRDVYDHLARIYELVETSRDLLGNALDAYLSIVSNRLNEVMKRLTLIATIFMPISFLAGLGGINFQQMPFNSPVAFVVFLGVIALVPVVMLIWFWRSKWV